MADQTEPAPGPGLSSETDAPTAPLRTRHALALSADEWRSFVALLRRYATHDLDQFETWLLDTAWGDVFVNIGRALPEGEDPRHYQPILDLPRSRAEAAEALQDAAALWSVGRCAEAEITGCARLARKAGFDGPRLRELGRVGPMAAPGEAARLLPPALEELGLNYYEPGSPAGNRAAALVLAGRCLADRIQPRDFLAWARETFRPGEAPELDDLLAISPEVEPAIVTEAWRISNRSGRLLRPKPIVDLEPGGSLVFHRVFVIGLYKGSMGRLLLRSDPTQTHPTRIDVLFVNTQHISLPTVLEGLEVRDVTGTDEGAEIERASRLSAGGGDRLYQVITGSGVGHIVAGAAGYIEDQGQYWEPSTFDMEP